MLMVGIIVLWDFVKFFVCKSLDEIWFIFYVVIKWEWEMWKQLSRFFWISMYIVGLLRILMVSINCLYEYKKFIIGFYIKMR